MAKGTKHKKIIGLSDELQAIDAQLAADLLKEQTEDDYHKAVDYLQKDATTLTPSATNPVSTIEETNKKQAAADLAAIQDKILIKLLTQINANEAALVAALADAEKDKKDEIEKALLIKEANANKTKFIEEMLQSVKAENAAAIANMETKSSSEAEKAAKAVTLARAVVETQEVETKAIEKNVKQTMEVIEDLNAQIEVSQAEINTAREKIDQITAGLAKTQEASKKFNEENPVTKKNSIATAHAVLTKSIKKLSAAAEALNMPFLAETKTALDLAKEKNQNAIEELNVAKIALRTQKNPIDQELIRHVDKATKAFHETTKELNQTQLKYDTAVTSMFEVARMQEELNKARNAQTETAERLRKAVTPNEKANNKASKALENAEQKYALSESSNAGYIDFIRNHDRTPITDQNFDAFEEAKSEYLSAKTGLESLKNENKGLSAAVKKNKNKFKEESSDLAFSTLRLNSSKNELDDTTKLLKTQEADLVTATQKLDDLTASLAILKAHAADLIKEENQQDQKDQKDTKRPQNKREHKKISIEGMTWEEIMMSMSDGMTSGLWQVAQNQYDKHLDKNYEAELKKLDEQRFPFKSPGEQYDQLIQEYANKKIRIGSAIFGKDSTLIDYLGKDFLSLDTVTQAELKSIRAWNESKQNLGVEGAYHLRRQHLLENYDATESKATMNMEKEFRIKMAPASQSKEDLDKLSPAQKFQREMATSYAALGLATGNAPNDPGQRDLLKQWFSDKRTPEVKYAELMKDWNKNNSAPGHVRNTRFLAEWQTNQKKIQARMTPAGFTQGINGSLAKNLADKTPAVPSQMSPAPDAVTNNQGPNNKQDNSTTPDLRRG